MTDDTHARPAQTDEQLMIAVREHGRGRDGVHAFDALFARYRTPIWAFFRRRVADRAGAEDMAQDTFVALLAAAPRYEPRAAFRSFLFGIAFNVLSSHRRRLASTPTPVDLDARAAARAGASTNPDVVLHVRRSLAALEPADRDVLMLREFDGLSYADIAEVLAMPINTVRSRLFRARMALREKL